MKTIVMMTVKSDLCITNYIISNSRHERKTLKPRLFPLFEPKKGVLKKAKPKNAFGKPKTQLFFIKVAF